MKSTIIIFILILAVLAAWFLLRAEDTGRAVNSTVISEPEVILEETDGVPIDTDVSSNDSSGESASEESHTSSQPPTAITGGNTSRTISLAESITLPLSGSAPTENVKHSIPIEEIRRGCFRQDCIPSVDNPVFISINDANQLLPEDTVGLALLYKGVERFYPFNMLVTREIVNDVVAGDPILVTYCPLCGTGIVFDRRVNGSAQEFGVSGMLWQSNLLMYNRAQNIEDRNLWSQVLGEAVVGEQTGNKLTIIPSNIVRYVEWRDSHPNAEVLNTGRIGDPYGGEYYRVASNFAPNFNESTSPLDPSAYVFGVEIDGQFKAYSRDALPVGSITDSFAGEILTVTKTATDEATITRTDGSVVPTVSGFWFSWVAAHPETTLWEN